MNSNFGLTTSQFVTAPKHICSAVRLVLSLTTSQFVTAPKRKMLLVQCVFSLTTSQFVTAPKPIETNSYLRKDRQTN